MKYRFNIKAKLIFVIFALVLSTIGTLSYLSYHSHKQNYVDLRDSIDNLFEHSIKQSWKERIKLVSIVISDQLIQIVHNLNMHEIHYLCQLVGSNEIIESIYVLDLSGMVMGDGGGTSEALGQTLSDPFTLRGLAEGHYITQWNKDTIQVSMPLKLGEQKIGLLRMGFNIQKMNDAYRSTAHKIEKNFMDSARYYRKQILYSAIIIIIVGFFLAHLLSTNLTKPIRLLVGMVNRVGHGNYVFTANLKSKDEIGELYSAFSKMVSDLKKREEALKREIEERGKAVLLANQANQTKDIFLRNMSHELRTPLNHVIGFTELIKMESYDILNDEQQGYVEQIAQSGTDLLTLIDNIMDLSALHSDKIEFNPTKVNLLKILEESLLAFEEKAAAKKIQLSKQISHMPDEIIADEPKLKQILFNLLSNAMTFTPNGGKISITANVAVDGKEINISITDTGIGIDPEKLEVIFDPFKQLDENNQRKFQGTGIGLSLTRKLVELHKGKIYASSKGEDMGSTFSFTIPSIT